MARLAVLFHSEDTANQLVSGIPCAARAMHRLRELSDMADFAPGDISLILVAERGRLSTLCIQEINRLAPDLAWEIPDETSSDLAGNMMAVGGEALVTDERAPARLPLEELLANYAATSVPEVKAQLRSAGKMIIKATGKPSDGLVSRYLNRPISQFLSRIFLRFPVIRPIHATILAGLFGVAMALCLLFGGSIGVIYGALLFQGSSIIDGVDGEIARATHRSSKLGATLDTATDAATNLAFIAGLAANLWQQGQSQAALVGIGGLSLLLCGLTILGVRSLQLGGPLTFDLIKDDVRESGSAPMAFLAKITSRDFYALAFAVLVVFGLAAEALVIFALAALCWFLVVVYKLLLRPNSRHARRD